MLQGGPRDVNCLHLSVPLPSCLGSLSSPTSTEDAGSACRLVWCWGCCAQAQGPRWPILSVSRAVFGAQCLSCWLLCTSSVGGPSRLLSQHNSGRSSSREESGQEAPSRSAQCRSCFLPGACAGRGYLCLPVWVAGDSFPWHPRPGCCTL